MVKQTYHFWARWIGTNTRVNNLVFNTEYRKCYKITEQDVSDPSRLPSYSEQDLLDMMNFVQVKLIAHTVHCYPIVTLCCAHESLYYCTHATSCSFVSQFMNAGKCASKALWPNGSKTDLQADKP